MPVLHGHWDASVKDSISGAHAQAVSGNAVIAGIAQPLRWLDDSCARGHDPIHLDADAVEHRSCVTA